MKKKKLKSFVFPTIITILVIGIFTLSIVMTKSNENLQSNEQSLNYVSNTILDNEIAVINTTTKMINPYTDASVKIGKYFYDYKAEKESQEKSIIFHDDTYMQNSGIDFTAENTFDVIAVLDGTVSDVKEDETLGKIIEIKHDNEYITIYQSLSETSVKKGDTVTQGQVIGKSGTNELDKDMGNHLHFELYVDAQIVDPSLYLNKEITSSTKDKE